MFAENIFQFDRPGIGSVLTYTAVEGVVLLLFVVLVEVLHVHVCMYMYVSKYVYTYVCMYVIMCV